MTPAQQNALEDLIGRILNPDEVTQIDALLPARNDVQIAAILSAGRVRYVSKMLSERGVRAALPIPAGSALIRLLKEAADTAGVPAWLADALNGAGVPGDYHQDYAEALGSAYGWLRQEGGLDIGAPAVRSMLDLIAMVDGGKYAASVATLKALAAQPDPIHFNQVSDALNAVE